MATKRFHILDLVDDVLGEIVSRFPLRTRVLVLSTVSKKFHEICRNHPISIYCQNIDNYETNIIGSSALFRASLFFRNITELTLGIDSDPKFSETFIDFLVQHGRNVKKMNFRGEKCVNKSKTAADEKLRPALSSLVSLRGLVLNWTAMLETELKLIERNSKSLEEVEFRTEHAGGPIFPSSRAAEALSRCPRLRKLKWNDIRWVKPEEGRNTYSLLFSDTLRSNLETLSLYASIVKYQVFEVMAAGRPFASLQLLDIAFANDNDTILYSDIIKVVKQCPRLKEIRIRGAEHSKDVDGFLEFLRLYGHILSEFCIPNAIWKENLTQATFNSFNDFFGDGDVEEIVDDLSSTSSTIIDSICFLAKYSPLMRVTGLENAISWPNSSPGGSFLPQIWLPILLAVGPRIEHLRVPKEGVPYLNSNMKEFQAVNHITVEISSISDLQFLSFLPNPWKVKVIDVDFERAKTDSGRVLEKVLSTFPYVQEIVLYPPFSENSKYLEICAPILRKFKDHIGLREVLWRPGKSSSSMPEVIELHRSEFPWISVVF